MAQFTWPPVSVSGSSNPSVGQNGDTAPTSSNQAGGTDANGDLQPIKVGTDGTQYVILAGTSAVSGHVIVDSGTISQILGGTISSISSGTVTLNGTPAVAVASGTLGLVSSLASGTVTLSGAPAISGTVAVSNIATGTVTISGTHPVTVTSGTLGLVSSLASGTVTLNGAPAISGTVAVSNIATGTVTISGTPAIAVASGTLGLVSSLASGTVTINGTPAVSSKAATPTAGSITQAAVAVGTTAVRATVSGSAPGATRSLLVITIDPTSAAKFYLGTSTVTNTSTTRGPVLTAGQTFIANNDAGDYYIISDTATQTVFIMEQT